MNKGTCTAKNKIILRNLRHKTLEEALLHQYQQRTHKLRTRRKAKRRCKSVDEDVIKFKSMKCKNRGDRRLVWLRINRKKKLKMRSK